MEGALPVPWVIVSQSGNATTPAQRQGLLYHMGPHPCAWPIQPACVCFKKHIHKDYAINTHPC